MAKPGKTSPTPTISAPIGVLSPAKITLEAPKWPSLGPRIRNPVVHGF
jgi:hypothetical protein